MCKIRVSKVTSWCLEMCWAISKLMPSAIFCPGWPGGIARQRLSYDLLQGSGTDTENRKPNRATTLQRTKQGLFDKLFRHEQHPFQAVTFGHGDNIFLLHCFNTFHLCRCMSFCGASMIQRHLSKTFLSQSTILRPDVIFCDWIDLNCMRDGLQLQSLSFRLHSVSIQIIPRCRELHSGLTRRWGFKAQDLTP